MQTASDRAMAVEAVGPEMVLRGIQPGDEVIFEPSDVLLPRPGDVVVYEREGRLCFGEYVEPGLITHSVVPPLAAVTTKAHPILGVAIEVRRKLRPAPVSPQI